MIVGRPKRRGQVMAGGPRCAISTRTVSRCNQLPSLSGLSRGTADYQVGRWLAHPICFPRLRIPPLDIPLLESCYSGKTLSFSSCMLPPPRSEEDGLGCRFLASVVSGHRLPRQSGHCKTNPSRRAPRQIRPAFLGFGREWCSKKRHRQG